MSGAFSQAEWANLENRFKLIYNGRVMLGTSSIAPRDLLNREKCESYLDRMGSDIGSCSRRVTASMLAKRYAFLIITPVLYAMTVYNKGLHLTLDNCQLVTPNDMEYRVSNSKFPNLIVDELQITEIDNNDRTAWREHLLKQLFKDHLSPLFRSLSDAGQVPMPILWENAMVRIMPLYEDGLEEEEDPAVLTRLQDDYTYVTETAPASLFGEQRNPFARFIRTKKLGVLEETASYTRRTCCFYYEMSREYCRACPKIISV